MTDRKIGNMNELVPILEGLVSSKEPLLIIADDVTGQGSHTMPTSPQCALSTVPNVNNWKLHHAVGVNKSLANTSHIIESQVKFIKFVLISSL